MVGIYLITNKVNNKKYIGQSINIERRYKEHLRSGQPEKYAHKGKRDINTPIHKAMQKYGITNFSITILEECLPKELDEKEKYWISKYRSCEKTFGYNISEGGQDRVGGKGENHSQAKLTQKEVDIIKTLLKKTNKNLNEILQIFPFISKSTLSMINQGKAWHDDNESYPLRILPTTYLGSLNSNAKFTEEQVMEMRTLYSKGVTSKEIEKKYSHIASEFTIKAILSGKSYKNLPYWKYSEKKWIEPCIDYPQSLK